MIVFGGSAGSCQGRVVSTPVNIWKWFNFFRSQFRCVPISRHFGICDYFQSKTTFFTQFLFCELGWRNYFYLLFSTSLASSLQCCCWNANGIFTRDKKQLIINWKKPKIIASCSNWSAQNCQPISTIKWKQSFRWKRNWKHELKVAHLSLSIFLWESI